MPSQILLLNFCVAVYCKIPWVNPKSNPTSELNNSDLWTLQCTKCPAPREVELVLKLVKRSHIRCRNAVQ